jgi:hypothetical protein
MIQDENGESNRMKKWHPLLLAYLVLAIILFQTAYVSFISHQPVVFRNEHGEVVSIRDLTTLFRIISATALVVGLLLLVAAIRGYFSRPHAREVDTGISPKSRRPVIKSGRFWIAFNVILVGLSVWTGYAQMDPAELQRTNPDLIFCIAVFVGAFIVAVGSVHLAKSVRLRRPKWNRLPFNWWSDPLQSLFIFTWCSLALVIGSVIRVRGSGTVGAWTVIMFGSVFVGLLAGQAVAYRLYRNRIGEGQ